MVEFLKEGFHLANRNLLLVFVRIAVTMINMAALIVFLGLPMFVAIMYLGFDMAHAENLLPLLLERPLVFLSRYTGIVALIGASLLLYLLFASVLILYTLGGTLGVLKNSALQAQYRFSLASFFGEARSHFARLFRLLVIESLVFVAVLGVLISGGAGMGVLLRSISGSGTAVGIFFGSLVLLTVAVFGLIWLMIFFVVIILSVVISVTEGSGTGGTFKRMYEFLRRYPRAFFLPVIFFIGTVAANVGLFAARFSYSIVPMFFPFTFIVSVFGAVLQNYLTLIAWSFLVVYYLKASGHTDNSGGYEI